MKRPFLSGLIGLGFGGFCLWLALRQVDAGEIRQTLARVDAVWVGWALVFYAANISLRIVRWMLLLQSVVDLKYRQVAAALITGYMVNNLLPARLGELYRADFVKSRHGVSRSKVLGTIFVERLMDAATVIVAFNVGLAWIWQAGWYDDPTLKALAGTATVGLIAVLAAILLARRGLAALERAIPAGLYRRVGDFAAAVGAIRRDMIARPMALTAGIYVFEFLTLHAVLKSAGIEVGVAATLITLGAVVLSTLLPTAPGYVGSMQLAFIVALRSFGATAPEAFTAASIFQVFVFGSVVACGMAILIVLNLRKIVAR